MAESTRVGAHTVVARISFGFELPEELPMDGTPRHEFTDGLYGWITHTELSSLDPEATRTWCQTVLGWTFRPPMPTPAGDYHLYAYSDSGGGGIRLSGDDRPGSVPFVRLSDVWEAHAAALEAGAESVGEPERVMEGVSTALVRAPGGVVIGFSGP